MTTTDLVDRLFKEALIQDVLQSISALQRLAAYSFERMSEVSDYPTPYLPHQIDLMLKWQASYFRSMKDANKLQKRLQRIIQFYLNSY